MYWLLLLLRQIDAPAFTPGYSPQLSFHSGRARAMGQHWTSLSTCRGKTRPWQSTWYGMDRSSHQQHLKSRSNSDVLKTVREWLPTSTVISTSELKYSRSCHDGCWRLLKSWHSVSRWLRVRWWWWWWCNWCLHLFIPQLLQLLRSLYLTCVAVVLHSPTDYYTPSANKSL